MLSTADGHFLAGFLEAEGCFYIRPNNGGQSWQCGMALKVRDDDADVLAELARGTELGRLTPARAQASSNPQILWHIGKLGECSRLAALVDRYPLRGRKRAEAAVWSRAVRALGEQPRPPEVPLAYHELRSLRRYVDPGQREPRPVVLPEDALACYLGGFFTGEGHFSISGDRARTVVRLREDDRPLLEAFAQATGLGSIYLTPSYRTSNPAAAWIILRHDQLPRIVELLERAGLRGRKLREFEVWREAALEAAKPAARRSRDFLDEAATRLTKTRAYRPPHDLPQRIDRGEEQKRAYVHVLRQAASLTDGPLSTTTYNALRTTHTQWPTRNTVAAAFGSWAAALRAAELGARCTGHARAHAAVTRSDYSERELLERRTSRHRVLEAVTALIDQRPGKWPTVHDFLAHRAASDRSLPSLSRLYNLFPSGWWSVLRQAGLPARPPRRA